MITMPLCSGLAFRASFMWARLGRSPVAHTPHTLLGPEGFRKTSARAAKQCGGQRTFQRQ